MATEDILIRYRADVSQLESDINKVIDSQEELTKATQQNTQAQQKAVTASEFAAKKRVQLLEQEKQKLEQIKNTQKTAFDSSTVEKYNQQIAASQKRIDSLGTTYKKAADQAQGGNQQILGGLNKIGAAFGVAFTAEALVQFAQQAVTAFLDAQEQADKLRFAVTSIGGEGEQALARLTAQAQELADTTFFGDDDITAAQAALSAFGLTADQIEEVIPKLADFAAVTGGTVTDAANTLGGALEGRAGEFKRFGIEVDASATKAENLAKVTQGLAQQAGAAGAALNTTAGKVKDFKDQAGELVEDVGQGLVDFGSYLGNVFITYFNVLRDALAPLIDTIVRFKNIIVGLIPDAVIDKLKEFFAGGNALKSVLEFVTIPLKVTADLLSRWYEGVIKVVAGISGLVNVFRTGFDEIGKTVTNVGGGISDVLNGIANFDTKKIEAGLNKVQGSFSKAGKDIANAFNEGYTSTLKLAEGTEEETNKAVEVAKQASEKIFTSDELRKKSLQSLNAELEKQKKIQSNAARQNVEAIQKEIEARKKAGEVAAKAAEEAKKQAEEVAKLLQSLDDEIAKVSADLAKRKIEIIPAETQQEQIDRIQALADLNEQAIADEIAGKVKLVQEDAKLSEKQKADVIAKYEELKQARLALANFNEQNELNIINQQQVDRIEAAYAQIDALDLEKALTIQSDKVETANEAVAKSFEDLSKAVSKTDFENAKKAAEERTAVLNQEIQNEQNLNVTRIENARDAELAKVKDGEAGAIERAAINKKYDNQIEESTKKTNNQIAKNNKELNDNITEEGKRATEERIAQTFEILQASQAVISELSNLFKQFSEQRISEIETEREAQLESLDQQLADNQLLFDQRRITEEQLLSEQKRISEEKVKIEKDAQKKILAEKRKQALLDKANALFEIALNTAIAVSNVLAKPALIPIVIAAGALQAAAVVAQPIPYRKGSKDTGPKGHLARVGEEGEELVFMPSNSKVLPARQTKKYSDIIDAMYDNKLDNFIYKNYITPALLAQQNAKENQRSKSFAENIANSITYNQSGLTASDLEAQRKRGQYIRNVDELASAIAKNLPTIDPYRR